MTVLLIFSRRVFTAYKNNQLTSKIIFEVYYKQNFSCVRYKFDNINRLLLQPKMFNINLNNILYHYFKCID
jgi:hypothetical protein